MDDESGESVEPMEEVPLKKKIGWELNVGLQYSHDELGAYLNPVIPVGSVAYIPPICEKRNDGIRLYNTV